MGRARGLPHLTELNHVDSALTSFNLRYEALRATQESSELDLSNAGSLTCCDEELNEFLMPLREDR